MSGLVRIRLLRLRIAARSAARRVAVVDRGPDLLVQPERVQRARLVLGERLGRVQVQRARGAVGAQHLERRQLEAQRLARRGAGGDDRRALERRVQRLRLVGVEVRDARARPARRGRPGAELSRHRHKARGARPIKIVVDQPLVARPVSSSAPRARSARIVATWTSMRRARARCAACTSISTGPCSGPARRCCAAPTGGSRSMGVRALEACSRADVEVVLYSGRRQSSVFEGARLIGAPAYVFELGCGLVIDGELEWLTDGVVPSAAARVDLRADRGARARRRCCWSGSRGGSSTTRRGRRARGLAPVPGSRRPARRRSELLDAAGLGWLRLRRQRRRARARRADGGAAARARLPPDPGRGVEGDARSRGTCRRAGYAAADCIAVGDSREDMDAAAVVGTFWLVANALDRDPDARAPRSRGGRACGSRPSPTAPACTRPSSRPWRKRGLMPATPNARYAIPTGSS